MNKRCEWHFEGESACQCIRCFDFKKDYLPKGRPLPSENSDEFDSLIHKALRQKKEQP